MINRAYIDGQNLHIGTTHTKPSWQIDHFRFRRYLRERFNIDEAYYYIGYMQPGNQKLYTNLQRAGFILHFREHNESMTTIKKGNVDTDIVFDIMRDIVKDTDLDKLILISGDGDYKRMVDYLISEDKLDRIIFPNRKFASSLYNSIPDRYKIFLDNQYIQKRICKQN